LPFVVAGLELSYGWIALCMVVMILVWMVQKRRKGAAAIRKNADNRMVLHTIKLSHYVEKVRWCLDLLDEPYDEVSDVGILGIFLTSRTVPTLDVPSGRCVLGNSSHILRYLYGAYSHKSPRVERFLRSTHETIALEKKFDEFGENIRRWAYYHILQHTRLSLKLWGLHDKDIPFWQRVLLVIFYPVLRGLVRGVLRISSKSAEESLAKAQHTFDELEALLSSDNRPFLTGDSISYIDITWASLAAIAVGPSIEIYAAGRAACCFPILTDLPLEMHAPILAFRERPAGKFALDLFDKYRLQPLQ